MKTKNLLQTITLVLFLTTMNQFANAQTCDCYDTKHHKTIRSAICDPNNLIAGKHYGCCVVVPCGARESEAESTDVIRDYKVSVYPSPISNSATISFSLAQSQKISLRIFDLNGRLIKTLADDEMKEGEHKMEWNADDVNAGIYFLQLQSAENLQTEKLIVTNN